MEYYYTDEYDAELSADHYYFPIYKIKGRFYVAVGECTMFGRPYVRLQRENYSSQSEALAESDNLQYSLTCE